MSGCGGAARKRCLEDQTGEGQIGDEPLQLGSSRRRRDGVAAGALQTAFLQQEAAQTRAQRHARLQEAEEALEREQRAVAEHLLEARLQVERHRASRSGLGSPVPTMPAKTYVGLSNGSDNQNYSSSLLPKEKQEPPKNKGLFS